MLHRNAKLTPAGRRLLVDRIASGRPVAHVATEMGVARQTAHRWWRRFVAEGESGLQDRSCRPRRSPRRTPRALERRIERLRRRQKLGPVRIGYRLGLAASTVYRVLCRLGLQRLSWLDRPTGRVIRRYEHPHPGDLLHMDIKKLGRIPPGGGWRAHGRGRAGARQRVGYAYIHSAVDDHSRLAYSEVLADERAVTVVAFWRRALAWFADRGVTAQAVLTDNGSAYRSADFARACLAAGIRHRRTRPYRPQTNGKVERFNRTLLEEWAYVRVYRSEQARTAALARWLHHYNHHRGHTALGGLPPVSRVTNSRDSTASDTPSLAICSGASDQARKPRARRARNTGSACIWLPTTRTVVSRIECSSRRLVRYGRTANRLGHPGHQGIGLRADHQSNRHISRRSVGATLHSGRAPAAACRDALAGFARRWPERAEVAEPW